MIYYTEPKCSRSSWWKADQSVIGEQITLYASLSEGQADIMNSLSSRIGEAVRKRNPIKTTSRRFQAGTRRTKRAARNRR